MEHQEKAKLLFNRGQNCSQAVVGAFSDILSVDEDDLLKIASSFGGGMGRMGEVCGALTGAFMVVGLLQGYGKPIERELKEKYYQRIADLAERFRQEKGSILCRDLLETNKSMEFAPGVKQCEHLIQHAVLLVEEMINEK